MKNILRNFLIIIDDKSMLSTLKENILKCKPYILCNKLNIENNGNQDKTEAEQENCSNENTNLSISFGKFSYLLYICKLFIIMCMRY